MNASTAWVTPRQSYVICTTPRSGSTLLCRLLSATGIAGVPDSHFHAPSVLRWREVYGLDDVAFVDTTQMLSAVFKAAIDRGMGQTPIFGLRLQRGSFDHFMQQLTILAPEPTDDAGRIQAVFGPTTFIHLTRPDRLGQAISLVRAQQEGLWHRHADGSELERSGEPLPIHYDRAEIDRTITHLTTLDAAWDRWFEKERLTPYKITYDTLAADPRQALGGILRLLSLNPDRAEHVKTPTAKLADAISNEWRRRYEQG